MTSPRNIRMSTLIVTFPASLPAATLPCSLVLTHDGQTVSQHTEAPLSLWTGPADAEVVAVLPIGQLSWHRVTLPKGTLERGLLQDKSQSRLRSVLDGLLEERLLDEPEQLHFAIQPQARAGEPLWVAACNRDWLHAWLLAVEEAGRVVSRIVPEMEPGAAQTGPSLHVAGTPDNVRLVCSDASGVCVVPLTASAVALLAGGGDAVAESQISAEPAVVSLAESCFSGAVRLQTAPQRALAAAGSAWDLAQFELLHSRSARTRKRLSGWTDRLLRAPEWKPARWAALAVVVVNLAGLQVWAWTEQAALRSKRAAVRDILTTTFPDVHVVVDATRQMERSLASLQRQSGVASNGDLEAMLGQFQVAAPELPTPQAIEFVANELQLKWPAAIDADIGSVNSRMQAYGYTVEARDSGVLIKPEGRP